VQLDPDLVLAEDDTGWLGIAEQGPGGACGLLSETRCQHHADRPSPCRLFPLHLHAGRTVQATLVLGCPGVELDPLMDAPGAGPKGPPRSTGLREELAWLDHLAATDELAGLFEEAQLDHAEAAQRSRGRSHPAEEPEARVRWATHPPPVRAAEFPVPEGPGEDDGLEALPLFHHPLHGIVALSESAGRVDLLALSARGGISDRLGSYPVPDRLPRLTPPAQQLLDGYLRLLVRRDAFADGVRLQVLDRRNPLDFLDIFEQELRDAGALVLSRSVLRAMLDGRPGGLLDLEDIANGVRATDAELLDRPVVGRNL
jgi:Fe-S-cluster containining protein